jgi:hypothetical protein
MIAGRFEIERPAGAGAMGEVYRALDRQAGCTVALKVLHLQASLEAGRFAREAEVLSTLRHPGIVRYVAHGTTAEGALYLAMEWLEGETLSERLAQKGLTIVESMALATHVAAALAEAHQRGVVHRDLKPSNLFLRGGSAFAPVLIDFGIARQVARGPEFTEPGAMVGTPRYMAPEQARTEPGVGPEADIYSLGCVLFQCLTGRSPFVGGDVIAVLMKVIFEEPPRLSELCPEAPAALEDLLARMLSKAKQNRPKDGARLLSELEAILEREPSFLKSPPALEATEITASERRMMSMIVVCPKGRDAEMTPEDADSSTLDQQIRAAVECHHGRLEFLADGSIVVVLAGAGVATDLAVQAVRCALSMRSLLDEAKIAVVSGREVLASRVPTGELVDRAVRLLGAGPAAICLDAMTSGLLGGRFELGSDAAGAYLIGQRGAFDARHTLLGMPTPFVGRERELALLESIVAQSIEECTAGAVIVTAAAGVGKSRLRHELIRRLRERGGPIEIWMGKGDPMTAGSAFGLLGQAIRGATGIVDSDPIAVRRERLLARVTRHFGAGPLAARVSAFVGEIVGTPFPDEHNAQLRAARRDPTLMGEQMRCAFVEFVAAACATEPVLLVLEDLHWGDLPTVRFVDAALHDIRDKPLVVLALARPEVHALFPDLWAPHSVQMVQLGELGPRACEQLVRFALGDGVSAETVKTTVEQAAGNAFCLEELIRAVAEGKSGAPPETVLAMIQARFDGFDAEARRVLRAASIFGETFWAGGVSALLGGKEVGRFLTFLTERKVFAPRGDGSEGAARFAGETEYSFRHTLLREVAYSMLTERDRAVGHRLAGEWLERAGEGDAGAVAYDPGR